MQNQTLLLAYAATDSEGVAREVSTLLDKDEFDMTDTYKLGSKLEHFLRACGLLVDGEDLVITG